VLDINEQQAMVPERCEVIVNKLGTAPIMIFRFGAEEFGHPATLYSLPGVHSRLWEQCPTFYPT
jgi:molybdopterin-biosynthesis enzyme MoeA-like protein